MMIIELIAKQLNLGEKQVKAVVDLFADGCTLPFIARYRKEMTGSLDEVQLADIQDLHAKYIVLEKRKLSILSTLEEQGNLTDALRTKITQCTDITTLEDIYLPFKPKKKTRAEAARDAGLEPIAKIIMAGTKQMVHTLIEQGLPKLKKDISFEDALAGVSDIIAEWFAERAGHRSFLRRELWRNGFIESKLKKGKEADGIRYKDYFKYAEKVSKIPSHRYLAISRAENESVVGVKITLDDKDVALQSMLQRFMPDERTNHEFIATACADGFKRLLYTAIEKEIREQLKTQSDEEAIKVFADNLKQLLLDSPAGKKRVLAIDPGFRSGCKVVCLDHTGALLNNETIFPFSGSKQADEALKKLRGKIEAYKPDLIAIGDGTGGRDTQIFIKERIKPNVPVVLVNEDGASVYSASKVAREEFPDYDVTVRGAVSIGRRLLDPMAELVKIEPKSIGVGQYQHDVNQTQLAEKLDTTVLLCVNQVGAELNTASEHLLKHVSGIGPVLAKNIIEYRKTNGDFSQKTDLLNVPRFGAKAFEQSAGFFRISNGTHPLDNTAVHPEAYKLVEKIAKGLGVKIADLLHNTELLKTVKPEQYTTDDFGVESIKDILKELEKPSRDPRAVYVPFSFSKEVKTIDDLIEGMVLHGVVSNIAAFGCFVDLGVKQDGLIHVSELADKYISNPSEIVQLKQTVKVKVLSVDKMRKRIALSLKQA